MSLPSDPVEPSVSLMEQLSGWSSLIAAVVALASLALSILAFRRSGPKIRVSLTSAFNLANGRAALFVRVMNNGPAAIQIQTVRLVSRLGHAVPTSIHGAPKLPCEIPAYGGSQQWGFDRQELRTIAASHAIAQQTEFRAVVTSGLRSYTSKDTELVHGGEPHQSPVRKPSLRHRLSLLLRGLIFPQLQIVNVLPLDSIDLNSRTCVLWIRNFGGGLGRGASLELIHSSEDGSVRERVAHQHSIRLPNIRRHKAISVTVPIQVHEGFSWALRLPDGRLSGVSIGALTLREAQNALSEAGSDLETS